MAKITIKSENIKFYGGIFHVMVTFFNLHPFSTVICVAQTVCKGKGRHQNAGSSDSHVTRYCSAQFRHDWMWYGGALN
jgi:hypothetical protein